MCFEFEYVIGFCASCTAPWLSSKTGKHGMTLLGNIKRQTCFKNNNSFTPLLDADLPTAPASDVPTPSTVAEADSSEHAAIWRNSRTREFRGLLQANTFGPA